MSSRASNNTLQIRFGITDWVDENRPLLLAETYEQRMRMVECADEAGFWCYHVTEHHGTRLNMVPSPHIYLAAVAQRTSRIRLGPLVRLLPLYNPFRNIEEVCMLDHLTNGRLELGVGRGVSPQELAIYGVTGIESRERFQESLDILLMGLTTGRVNYEGRYYSMKNVEVPLQPLQRPYPPLWYPTSARDRLDWIAERGFNTIFSFSMTRAETDHFMEVLEAHRGESDYLNAHVEHPLCGVGRHVFVADTDAEAVEVARVSYAEFEKNYVDRPERRPDDHYSQRPDVETVLREGRILVGSPETVRRGVQQLIDETGANYFTGAFAFGNLTTEQILHSIQLFAKEVMPVITGAPQARVKASPSA